MAYGVLTQIDDNIIIEKGRSIDILSDGIINRYVDANNPNVIQVWSDKDYTNNNGKPSFTRGYDKPVLLTPNTDGDIPVNPQKILADGNAQFLCNYHNIYISTFDINTLYANAYSNTLEIFVRYNTKEIILSSTVIARLNFKMSKFDLEYANRYYSNYCPVQVLDLKSMVLSGNSELLELVSDIIGVPAFQINETLFSEIQYRFGYIDRDTIEVPPSVDFFQFEVSPILSKPESPASWTLQGDLDVLIEVANNTVVVGLDQSNPNLMNVLNQIAGSVELLSIEYTLTFTSYKTTVNPEDFEYNGVHYNEASRYSIKCANTYEPVEAITIIPAISQDADLVTVGVLLQITSSNNTISLSKQVSKILVDDDLNQLKRVVYNINTEQVKISNIIETTQNVIQFKNTDSKNVIQTRQQLQFVTLKTISVNNLDGTGILEDATDVSIGLRVMPTVYSLKFVSEQDIDLRNFEFINILYAGRSNKPIKIEKDVIYFQLGWQNYDEIGIEINGVIATVVGAYKL